MIQRQFKLEVRVLAYTYENNSIYHNKFILTAKDFIIYLIAIFNRFMFQKTSVYLVKQILDSFLLCKISKAVSTILLFPLINLLIDIDSNC